MPPPSTKKKLTAAEKDLLTRWVASGADYQPHWSFIAPTRPEPPSVKNESWVRNPVDRFVLAKLEAERWFSASPPEADRRTPLARRLSLDLIGLPRRRPGEPGRGVRQRYTAPDAYEKLVDSPSWRRSARWGEHRGRYWLDAARYADTHGIHFDNFREVWAYRDWVINAFNRNEPFDQFTVEQLAGDLLPDRTLEQEVASGFNRCNITTNEGGAIAEEYLVLYNRDRTETTSQVWLGLTTGCAVCHDHKFDPISQKEFYGLSAFFNNTTQAAMDGNVKDTPPIVPVPPAEDRERMDALDEARSPTPGAGPTPASRPPATTSTRWLDSAGPSLASESVPAEGLRLLAPLGEGAGTSAQVVTRASWRQADLGKDARWVGGHVSEKALQFKPTVDLEIPEAGDFEADQPFSYGAWVQMPKNRGPPGRSSPGWTRRTTSAAGTSGSTRGRSGPTSSTSGRTTRSRWSPTSRSSPGSGTTCWSPTTARARRPG